MCQWTAEIDRASREIVPSRPSPTRTPPPSPTRTPLDFTYKYTARPPLQHIKQKTNTKPTNSPAILRARIPEAQRPAAVSSSSSKLEQQAVEVSSPPPFALGRWGFAAGGASSSDDEEEVKKKEAVKKRAPAARRSSKGAKGKNKYLVSPAAPPEAAAAGQGDHLEFMSGAPDLGDDDVLPSPFDPFADARAEDAAAASDEYVHLRVQQRNGKKTLTTVQGLSAGYNYVKVLRDLKKELCCNGTIVEDKELGKIIQLQGDHRKSVAGFLVRAGMVKKDNVKVHGF